MSRTVSTKIDNLINNRDVLSRYKGIDKSDRFRYISHTYLNYTFYENNISETICGHSNRSVGKYIRLKFNSFKGYMNTIKYYSDIEKRDELRRYKS